MKIAVIGTGYVGLVQGIIMSEFGSEVICVDKSQEKIEILNKGELPIYEPGLAELLHKNQKAKRISFTTDIEKAIKKSEVIFIAVGTPAMEDGSADLSAVLNVAEEIGEYINSYKVIVDKSTVPVGTGRKVINIIKEKIKNRNENIDFDVVSNPEFLREGKAVNDCLRPNRIVIGTESEKAKLKFIDRQAGDVDKTFACIDKAKKILNYKVSTKFEDGIENFVNWYRQRGV